MAERIVSAEVDRFQQRLQSLDAVPGILSLQQHAEQLRLSELERNRTRLADLSPQQQEAVEALTRSLMSKFLHAPLTGLRQSANEGDAHTLAVIKRLFARTRS